MPAPASAMGICGARSPCDCRRCCRGGTRLQASHCRRWRTWFRRAAASAQAAARNLPPGARGQAVYVTRHQWYRVAPRADGAPAGVGTRVGWPGRCFILYINACMCGALARPDSGCAMAPQASAGTHPLPLDLNSKHPPRAYPGLTYTREGLVVMDSLYSMRAVYFEAPSVAVAV